jgi:molecular chaperone DnaJ
LGTEIEVPTLNGKRNLTIPKGTESGEVLRMKGEGLTRMRGSGRGDQLVQVIIKTPRNLTKRQEEILREFEELGEKKIKGENGWKGFFKVGS